MRDLSRLFRHDLTRYSSKVCSDLASWILLFQDLAKKVFGLLWALLHHLQHKVSVQELYQQNRRYRREKGSTQKVTGQHYPLKKIHPHVAGQWSVTSVIEVGGGAHLHHPQGIYQP